jgi:hypothetical protein
MKNRVHRLKLWPSEWEAQRAGIKTYEIRRSDRDFAVGDTLELDEWDPERGRLSPGLGYTNRVLEVLVKHITRGGQWGLPSHACVLGTELLREGFRSPNDVVDWGSAA